MTAIRRAWRRHPRLCIFLGYAAIAALAAWPITFAEKTLGPEHFIENDPFYGTGGVSTRYYGDITPILLDYPRDMTIARSLRSASPFFWNPWLACGVPLTAEQSGAFFPLRILFYLAPGPATYTLFRMSRMVLAALGAFALARSRGRSQWASFVAGGLLELGGPVLWMLPFAGTSSAFVVPWLLLGVNLLFQRDARRGIAVTGGAIGAILLGGHPGIAVVSLLAGAAAFLGAALENFRAPFKIGQSCRSGIIATVLGFVIAGAAVLPFAELASVGHSYKATPIALSVQQANIALSRATWWLGAFAPNLVDTSRQSSYRYPYTLTSLYGVLTLFLALAAVLRGKLDLRLGAVAVAGIAISFAPPGLEWLANFPGLRFIPAPYAAILIAVPLAQWAASGLDLLPRIRARILVLRPRGRSFELCGRTVATVGVLAALAFLARLSFGYLDPAQQLAIGEAFAVSEEPWGAVPFLVAATAIGIIVMIGRRSPGVMGVLLGATAILELAAHDGSHFAEAVAPSIRHERPLGVAYVSRVVNEHHARMGSNAEIARTQYNMLDDIPDLRIIAALVPQRYHDYMKLLNGGDFFTSYAPAQQESPFLDLAAVRFFVLPDGTTSNLQRIHGERGWGLYLNTHAVARARLIYAVDIVDGEELAVVQLGKLAGDATHIAQTPLLERAVVELPRSSPLRGVLETADGRPIPRPSSPGKATFVKDEPDEVVVATETTTAALLLLADAGYPGWVAEVDGRRTDILPTDVLFRGVMIPPGKHLARFSYRSVSLRLGLTLSLLGTLGLAVLLWGGKHAKREARFAR